jgi:hypothetical protein
MANKYSFIKPVLIIVADSGPDDTHDIRRYITIIVSKIVERTPPNYVQQSRISAQLTGRSAISYGTH